MLLLEIQWQHKIAQIVEHTDHVEHNKYSAICKSARYSTLNCCSVIFNRIIVAQMFNIGLNLFILEIFSLYFRVFASKLGLEIIGEMGNWQIIVEMIFNNLPQCKYGKSFKHTEHIVYCILNSICRKFSTHRLNLSLHWFGLFYWTWWVNRIIRNCVGKSCHHLVSVF